MRNQWLFNAAYTSEKEVADRGVREWQEYQDALLMSSPPQHQRDLPSHSSTDHLAGQSLLVGYHTLVTSSITRRQSHKSSAGILATDHHGFPLQAQVNNWQHMKDFKCLAIEAIRDAQLLAYQTGWRKVIIQSDVQEIVAKILKNKSFSIELATIANDIIFLTNLFDDCRFSYIS